MATKSVTIRMEEKTKDEFETVLYEMGLNITTAFTIFAKAVINKHKIPFEISADPFNNPKNIEYLQKLASDMDDGKGKIHEILED